jgi:putative nucleotidyltransferase with HDIG domain
VLDNAARRIDTTARVGGEEFALLLPETSSDGAWRLAERIRLEVAEAFVSERVQLTVSFGIACYADQGETREQLLRAADQALYAAKELGRNRTVIHSPEVASILVGAAGRRDAQSQGHVATMLSLAEALDIRDSGTATHAHTVGRYAEGVAVRLGMPAARVERIRLAGILHDIGKIGVPDSILRKPGALDEHEWAVMRKHAETGARILESGSLEDVRGWVLAHHERPDGTGYPYGLPGDRIAVEASILAVADAYEAMTSDRVYRARLQSAAAREQLIQGSGSQFEPSVVTALLDLLDAEEEAQRQVAHNGRRAAHRDDSGIQPGASARGLQRL